ncbi:MAG: right-handed parallel beta-helix repeat-containing protein [Myxococcota bacterium]
MPLVFAILVSTFASGGCQNETRGGADAAPDAELPDANESILPPEAPRWTCPDGWQPSEEGCEPWPVGTSACPSGEVRFPGDAACHPVGSACPVGRWPENLPTDRPIIYVDAEAERGGSGTREDPFATLTSAIPSARAGTVVALSKGVHAEATLWVRDNVTVRGACVAETVLEQPIRQGGVLKVMGEGVELRDFTIRSSAAPCIVMSILTSANLERLILECTGVALDVRGAVELRGTDLLIQNTRIDDARNPLSDYVGIGLLIRSDSSASLERVRFEGGHTVGILADFGAEVTLRDAAILGTQPLEGQDGVGLVAARGARLNVERSTIEENHTAGLIAQDPWTEATLSDVVIRNSLPRALDASFGRALVTQLGARLSVNRVGIWRNRDIALEVRDSETSAELTDLTVVDTESNAADDRFGAGVHVGDGASLAGSRIRIQSNRHWGLAVIGEAQADVSDVRIEGTAAAACVADSCRSEVTGVGAASLFGGELRMARFAIEDSELAGIQLFEAAIDLSDGLVRGSPIGASISDPSIDPQRINTRVRYIDNQRNLDQMGTPPPALPEGVEGRRAQN